ncbi:MAG: acetyl-CoA carboxylase carboxyltransferase subunit alpha [Hyphomonadaceae bacterium]|nr:acetyl-CoA carboxylase carboxyltransferase subunit alpha [Clostridia bacterium]
MLTPWEKVQVARMAQRPTALYYIKHIFENFIELHGDRNFRDDPAIVGGIATLNGMPVTVIGQEKGSNITEKLFRSFGSTHPEGFRKALRLMKQAEKFNRPIVCFVDTQGAFCGIGAEERGQGQAIAQNLQEMMGLTVPVISVVLGEGGSGGALAVAVANEVYMLEHAVYSILSPEGFATILWKDSTRAQEAAKMMKMTAQDLLSMQIIDGILPEPAEGAHTDPKGVAKTIGTLLQERLTELKTMTGKQISQARYERFRKF